jgi:hypothetical protein
MSEIMTVPKNDESWTGEVTLYASTFSPIPQGMYRSLTWEALQEAVAPTAGPMVHADKTNLRYFTPGLLQAAPLTGKTLQRASAQGFCEVGFMRSAGHVTTTTWMVFDFDGITRPQVEWIGRQVFVQRYAALMYTTHSHGRPDKQGARLRIVLPVDMRLDAGSYRDAHMLLNIKLFNGLADQSGKSLSQQQAVFGVHPSRAHLAKCWRSKGAVYRLAGFLARERGIPIQVPKPPRAPRDAVTHAGEVKDLPTHPRLKQALRHLSAKTYQSWAQGLMAFKALAGFYPDGEMRAMAVAFGNTSPSGSTRAELSECDSRYDPGAVFDASAPLMPPNAAAGVLLGMAKEQALAAVRASRGATSSSAEVMAAAAYLAAHHHAAWEDLLKGVRS